MFQSNRNLVNSNMTMVTGFTAATSPEETLLTDPFQDEAVSEQQDSMTGTCRAIDNEPKLQAIQACFRVCIRDDIIGRTRKQWKNAETLNMVALIKSG